MPASLNDTFQRLSDSKGGKTMSKAMDSKKDDKKKPAKSKKEKEGRKEVQKGDQRFLRS